MNLVNKILRRTVAVETNANDKTKESPDHDEDIDKYRLEVTHSERETLEAVRDWLEKHRDDQNIFGASYVDVNNTERCARQRQIRELYIDDAKIESNLPNVIALINDILTTSAQTPAAPTKEYHWLNAISSLSWKSSTFDDGVQYCTQKRHKLFDSDQGSFEIQKQLAETARFLSCFPERVGIVYKSDMRQKIAQRQTSESDACAAKAVQDIVSNGEFSLLNYSPRVYPYGKMYRLDNIDSTCELAYILRKVKVGLEGYGFYVDHLSYPAEDGYYSSIHAKLIPRSVREENVKKEKESIKAKEEARQEYIETSIQYLKDDIDFFTRKSDSDPFHATKIQYRERAFLNNYEQFRDKLDADWYKKAKSLADRLQERK